MLTAHANKNDGQLLLTLSQLPFLSGDELAALTGIERRTLSNRLERVRHESLVDFVRYSRSQSVSLRRWYLTLDGVRLAAEAARTDLKRFMLTHPVSIEWQRWLLRMIEALDLFYQLMHEVTELTGAGPEWNWCRGGPFDAVMRLADGKRFGVTRLGSTHSWESTRKRLGSLLYAQKERDNPIALVVVPGEVEKRRAAAFYKDKPILMLIGSEKALLESGMNAPTWEPAGTELRNATLETVLKSARRRGRMPKRMVHDRDKLPTPNIHDGITEVNFLGTELRPAERNMLRLLYDWPLVRNEDLPRLLGVSSINTQRSRRSLMKKGLVYGVELGGSYKDRRTNGSRLALSNAGLRLIGWTDRRRTSDLAKHWRLDPSRRGQLVRKTRLHRFEVQGTKLKTLIGDLHHTDAVSEITAMLVEESITNSNFVFLEGLPPHRWSRVFMFNGKRAQVSPDATYLLQYRGQPDVNFLEYEERASVPSRMRAKISGFVKYYGAMETREDFDDVLPRTLFVFRNVETASRFSKFVIDEGTTAIPLVVSSLDILRSEGVFGNAWVWPWELGRGRVPLSMIRRSR